MQHLPGVVGAVRQIPHRTLVLASPRGDTPQVVPQQSRLGPTMRRGN